MFIEAREDLESPCGVMNLVKAAPEKLRFVSVSMPPVVNEGGKDIDDDRGWPIAHVTAQVEDRRATQPAVPSLTGEDSDEELNRID